MTADTEKALLTILSSIDLSLKEIAKHMETPKVAAPTGAATSAPAAAGPVVPFGKNKGKPLSELSDKQLGFYAFTWQPSTSEQYPKPSPRDAAFKRAAEAEAKRRGLVPEGDRPAEVEPAAASTAPKAGTQEQLDEDVPF